jgi:Holliday junction DNA helicase RuvA
MIGYLKGEIAEVKDSYTVVDVGGIGYEVFMPTSALMRLPSRGSIVKIYTYMHVREDAISLYGFLTKEDLNMFKLLINVSGIGPKGALSILSSISADEIRFAVLSEDVKTLAKAPGIGNKTAGKLILELKDKFGLEEAFEQRLANNTTGIATGSSYFGKREEAVQALIVLGYSGTDAAKIVSSIEITEDMTVEDILKLCLKKL